MKKIIFKDLVNSVLGESSISSAIKRVVSEKITVNGMPVEKENIKSRTHGLSVSQIQNWMDENDGLDFASFPDIIQSLENGETKKSIKARAFEKIKATVYSWLNLTEDNEMVDEIIRKHLEKSNTIPTTNKSIKKFVDGFWEEELKSFKQPKQEN